MYRVFENPMSAWRGLPRPLRYLACALLVTALLGFAMANAKADTIKVNLDQAQVMRLPAGVATVVIGKGYGTTNMVALDRGGRVLMDKTVTVGPPRAGDLVVVYKGIERESYTCAPECAPRITVLGDNPAYFNAVLGETNARSGAAATT